MKANAIARIVIYSIVIVLLLGLLLAGLGVGMFVFNVSESHETVLATGGGSVEAHEVSRLEIHWAAGSVTIQTGNTEQITFSESGNFRDSQAMVVENRNGTLHLSYAEPHFQIGLVSTPTKHLVITVPENWDCRALAIDGAALEISIEGLSIRELELDGAAAKVRINGVVEVLDCDGAACEITWNCTERPGEIELDGAACRLELMLPEDCGFRMEMDGLSCELDTDLAYTREDGNYVYGDRHCKINVDGMACEVKISQ